MRVLALDVGTSSVKAAVLDAATMEPVGAIERVEYTLDHVTPEAATLDPDALWHAVVEAGRKASRGQRVEGVGFSCLTPALVLLNEKQEPVTPIITHLDRRSRSVARRVGAEVGQEFLASVGNKPLPGGLTVMAYRQLVADDPELPNHVKCYLHVNGWLGLRCTGTAAFDSGNASFTGLFDTMGTRDWSQRWCDYFEVPRDLLPPVRSGDEMLGGLLPSAAKELGLPAGIPVKLGTADTSCAMLAAGMGPRDLLHLVGTTQVLAVHAQTPVPATHRLTRLIGVGTGYIHVTHNPVGGVALDWLRGLCFQDQEEVKFWSESVPAALERQTEVMLDPPFLGGDRLEIEPKRAAFRELGLATDRLDLLAAVLVAMREHHYPALKALGEGLAFDRVFLSGGAAEAVQQLIPEYAKLKVVRLEEASLRGVGRLFAPEPRTQEAQRPE